MAKHERSAAEPSEGSTRVRDEVARAAFSIDDFCAAHSISRALFYLLQKDRRGPRVMRVRGRTLVTAESAAEWRKRMEDASEAA